MRKPGAVIGSLKKLLFTATFVALAASITLGQEAAQNQADATSFPKIEIASIRQNRATSGDLRRGIKSFVGGFDAINVQVEWLLEDAYHVKEYQISGGPAWIHSDRYNINARIDEALAEELKKKPELQRPHQEEYMVQSLLADRFKLAFHREKKDLPVYALVIAKNGSKLHEAKNVEVCSRRFNGISGERGHFTGDCAALGSLTRRLSDELDRPVLDQTGLASNYDFTLDWTPDARENPMFKGSSNNSQESPRGDGPSLFTALEEQLGLKLKAQKAPVEMLVIDRIDRPSEN